MFARVITFNGDHVKEVVKFIDDAEKGGLEKVKEIYVLADLNNKKTMTVSLWNTKGELEDSLPAAEEIAEQISRDITGTPYQLEVYEVAHRY